MNTKYRIISPVVISIIAAIAIPISVNSYSKSELAPDSTTAESATTAIQTSTIATTTVPTVVTETKLTEISTKHSQVSKIKKEESESVSTKKTVTTTVTVSIEPETPSISEEKETETPKEETTLSNDYTWDGPKLNVQAGIVSGPSGNETFYNLDMSRVVSIMQSMGYDYKYWLREDGVKMYGNYVMVAADLSIRPRGTLIPTSLGMGIVCDTGSFVDWDATRIDIATNW